MRKLLLENVSSVPVGSQVTQTQLTAQELDKIRIMGLRKKKSFSLVYSRYKNALESANQTGGSSSSSMGILVLPWCPGEQGGLSWQDQGWILAPLALKSPRADCGKKHCFHMYRFWLRFLSRVHEMGDRMFGNY